MGALCPHTKLNPCVTIRNCGWTRPHPTTLYVTGTIQNTTMLHIYMTLHHVTSLNRYRTMLYITQPHRTVPIPNTTMLHGSRLHWTITKQYSTGLHITNTIRDVTSCRIALLYKYCMWWIHSDVTSSRSRGYAFLMMSPPVWFTATYEDCDN